METEINAKAVIAHVANAQDLKLINVNLARMYLLFFKMVFALRTIHVIQGFIWVILHAQNVQIIV